MKFGKEFTNHLEETIPEWRDKFLCYKLLKKLLKLLPISAVDSIPPPPPSAVPLIDLQSWFIIILNHELDKLNDFYVDKEEDFIIQFQELKGRIKVVREKSSRGGVFTSESELSEKVMDIRKDFVTIHGEMVLLKNYSSLNFAGLVKILKKYDKRTGGLLRLPFTQLALRAPFFTTQPLTMLVRECEANLELLFPLEAEVIESTPDMQDNAKPQSNSSANVASDSPSNQEANVNIYRGTIAAMKAIQGLQKESSTWNPWSISKHSRNQDDESTGAVTAENSASNSVATLHSEEEADGDDNHSS